MPRFQIKYLLGDAVADLALDLRALAVGDFLGLDLGN